MPVPSGAARCAVLAALLLEPGRVVVDTVPAPAVGVGEVRVAVGGVGLCGSDLALFHGNRPVPGYPWIMGHEAFGTIESVGAGVPEARMGERVVIEPNIPCRECPECRRGLTSGCRRRLSVGMNRQGALAELVTVPAHLAWPIQVATPADLVCVEPLAVVETALRRLPDPLPPEALVIGAGAQGLLMTLALQRRSVGVVVSDVNRDRVAFATARLGATALGIEDDRSFELIVDTAGVTAAMAQAVRLGEVGATILELGLDGQAIDLSAETLVRRQLVLRGSLTYDHPHDFRHAVGLVETNALTPGLVVREGWPLSEAQRAFEAAAGVPGKLWVRTRSA
jgi:alcohol dehydrogenase/L-iditol 2-dehydrogenase